jgi:hypothetical protein
LQPAGRRDRWTGVPTPEPIREPLVRIHFPSPEDEIRCRAVLVKAGLAPEAQLTWIAVRDEDPDRVNDLLVEGGALGRVVVREQIGKLIGFVIDHGPALEGRAGSLRANVTRILSTAGLSSRWAPRPESEMGAAGSALHEYLMATRGGFVSWERFTGLFCRR